MLSTEERDLGAWEAGVSDLGGVATLERREGGPSISFYLFCSKAFISLTRLRFKIVNMNKTD